MTNSKLKNSSKILIVDDEEKIRDILFAILKDLGYEVQTCQNGQEALNIIPIFKPNIILVDLYMPGINGIDLIHQVKSLSPEVIFIIITAHGTISSAVSAIKEGIYDYISKPFDNDYLISVIKHATEYYRLNSEVDDLKNQLGKNLGIKNIVGETKEIKKLRNEIIEVASSDATVIIFGESGTGKELVAKAIHFESKRHKEPFIILDCTSIPENLTETIFFGHEKGAFTDAVEKRIGKFEAANKGSIFFDEISELPLYAQAKLLRVLQEREFTRVGSNSLVKIDFRVIAATNRDLQELINQGKFREDLFYRLNVLIINVPSLRQHIDDIPLYAKYFVMKHSNILNREPKELSESALDFLQQKEWKGNIRQLENSIQRALFNSKSNKIEIKDFDFLEYLEPHNRDKFDFNQGLEIYINNITQSIEKDIILKTLIETMGNKTAAADKLKISRKTLFNKLKSYNIS